MKYLKNKKAELGGLVVWLVLCEIRVPSSITGDFSASAGVKCTSEWYVIPGRGGECRKVIQHLIP